MKTSHLTEQSKEKTGQALLEAEQRRLREVEEELGNGLIMLREKLHRQEVCYRNIWITG